MALTATVKTDLYRFFAIAFDAAPGVTYMTQLAEASAAGMSVAQIVEVFTTKPQFTATYPTFLTNGDFATKLVENVVGGSASAAAKAEAVADIEAALSAGWSRGKVIYQVFNNLANKMGDAKWGGTAAQMANQVAYAQYYTEVLLGDTTNLATLRGVIAGVTPTTDVTPAAINAVLNPPPVVVQPSYALSANAAAADEGTSVLFTLTTANVAAGSTFTYTLGGVNASDVVGGSLSGVATVGNDGKAIIQVNLAADATTDGAKTLTLAVAGQTAAVAVNDTSLAPVVVPPATYALAPSVASADEGTSVLFTLTTANVAAGSTFTYTLGGVNASDVAGGSLTGVATVGSDGKAVIQVNLAADATTDGAKTLTVTVAGKTAAVAVNDTSTAPVVVVPTYALTAADAVAEGAVSTFLLQTTGLAAGSQVGYKITGAGSAAAQTTTGVFTVDSAGSAAVAVVPASNSTIGDSGTLTLELLNGQAAAKTVSVTDATSKTTGVASITAANAGAGIVTINVEGTAAQTITLSTDQVTATNGFVINALTAPVSVTSGAGNDKITVVGAAGNTISTGAGNDTVVLSTVGNTTIDVGTGSDTITGTSGNESVTVGSGDLSAADAFDLGTGTDTVTISGNGNVVTATNLKGVENLVLNGTKVTFNSAAALATVKSVSGSSATSELTVDVAGTDVLDLTGLALDGIKQLTLNVTGGAGAVTLKADAADLTALGAVLKSGAANLINLETDVAGYKALAAADTGITGTKTVTDTAAAIIADKSNLTVATIVVSDTVTAADVLSLPAGSARTVSLSVSELLVAAQYPDQKAALTAADTKIKVVGDATVAQAQTLIINYSGQILAYTGAGSGITVSDTAANIAAGLAAGVPNEVSGYKIAAGSAAIAIGTAGLTNLAAQAAASKVISGTFSVKGTVADVVANVANNVVTKAASVTLNAGQKATSVADALALKGLGTKLSGGYTFELDSQGMQTAGDSGLSALAGAASAKITTSTVVIDVSKLGIYQASNAAVKIDVLEDNPANLVAGGSAKLAAATTSIKVVGSVTVAQASALQSAVSGLSGNGFTDGPTTINAYRIADTKAAVVGASNAVLGAATKISVTGAMTLAEAKALYAAATASGTDALSAANLTYSVSDTAGNLAAGLTAADAATVGLVLAQAVSSGGSITANTAATVAQGATLAAAVPAIAFDVADSVTNVQGIGVGTLAEMTKISVNSGDMTIAQVAALKAAAGAKFDNVYSIADTAAAIVDTADVRAATSVTVTTAATVADLADIKALNAARTTAGKSTVSYTLADSYANVVAGWAGNSTEIKAATSIKMTAAFSGGSAIDGNALADLTDKFGSTTPYALEVTDTSATILGAGVLAGVLQDAKITKIIVSDAMSVANGKLVAQKAGSASAKTQYDLSDSIGNLTAAADAASVLAARNLTATGNITVAQANSLEALTGAAGSVSYSVSDTYANLIANPAVTDKATSVTVSPLTTLTVAQYANLMSVANATGSNSLVAMPITDTAAAVSGASASVLDSASNVTLTDVGYITLTSAQAKGLFSAGNYKLSLAPGEPLVGAAPAVNVKVKDTTDNLIALKNAAVAFDADSAGVLGSAQSVKFEATDTVNLTKADAATLVSIGAKLSASFNLSDTASNVATSAQLGVAKAVTVTGTSTAADATTILNGKAATAAATINVVDTAAALTGMSAANLAKLTAITADNNLGTPAVDGISASNLATLLANKGSVPLTANIADSATNIKAAAAATLAAAGTVTVSGVANASEAAFITGLSNRAGTFAVTDSPVNVAANLTAAASAGGNVTLSTANPTVDQYSAIKAALGSKLVPGSTVEDTAAKIADFLLAGNTADNYALTGTTAVSVAQAAKILATAALAGTTTLQVSGTQADLMTLAAGQAKYTVTGGAIDLWQAKQLDATFTSAKTSYAIATTSDRFLAAYDTDAATAGQQPDAAQKTALQKATSLTVDGVAITLGSKNANLSAGNEDKILGTVAELNALSSSLKAAAKYIVVDTVANITSAANTSVLNAAAGYVVADTAAAVAAASAATLATASGARAIQITDQATVAQAAAIVAATNLLAANVRFELTDTATNLANGLSTVNKAAKVAASTPATAAQADAIVGAGGGGATAKFSLLDTGSNIATMGNESKATDVTADADLATAGLQGISIANATAILTSKGSGTVTFNVADTVGAVAAAAANAAKAGTVTVTGTATVTEAKTVAGLANLTGGYQVSGTSADLTDATKITMADLAKASKVTATDPATVAQANALLSVSAIAKDATSGKPLLSIADTAKALAGASAATLDSVHTANTVTVNSYAAALTAAEATNLAVVDAASTKLASDAAQVKVSDSAANILSAANAGALAKVGSIAVTDTAITVATLNQVRALNDNGGNVAQTYSYSLSDGVIALVAAGPATFNGATKLTVTGSVSLADAQTTFGMYSNVGVLPVANLSFEKITGSYTDLTTATLSAAAGAVTATPLSKSAAVSLTSAINLTQAADAAFMAKLAGGYLLSDTAATVLAGVMNDSGKALMAAATSVSLSDTASVSQAQVIASQLSNETALPVKDTATNLKAASAAATVAAAASVVVVGSTANDALSKSATTAKVTYELSAANMEGVATTSNGTTTFAAGVDVLSLKAGDAISLVGLGGLTLDAGGALTAGEYKLTRGVYAADGSFVALSSGNDLMIEIETAGNTVAGAADEVVILVGTTTVTAVGTAGNVTGFTGG